MNFCNVSPLNCLKITNFYCTRVKLLQFDDYLRIKVSKVYYSLLVYLNFMEFPACLFIRACLIIRDTRVIEINKQTNLQKQQQPKVSIADHAQLWQGQIFAPDF